MLLEQAVHVRLHLQMFGIGLLRQADPVVPAIGQPGAGQRDQARHQRDAAQKTQGQPVKMRDAHDRQSSAHPRPPRKSVEHRA